MKSLIWLIINGIACGIAIMLVYQTVGSWTHPIAIMSLVLTSMALPINVIVWAVDSTLRNGADHDQP